jgi:hypothetical protein
MMRIAAQGEKNDPGQSQIPFPGQSILTGSRRHDIFWRLANSSAYRLSYAGKKATYGPEAGFATRIHNGCDQEYTPETHNKVY